MSFADSQHGWIGGSNGVILHTSDGGNSWLKEETGSEAPIYGLLANTSGVYAVGGFGTFLERKVSDAGTVTWTQSSAVSTRFYLRAITPLGKKILLGGGAGTLRSLIDDGSGQLIAASVEQGV